MAYLYQEITKVPGLSGTARQRQEQLFKKLYPKEKYVASYEQNIRLLGDIQSGKYKQVTQSSSSKKPDAITSTVKAIVDKAKQVKNFEDILKFEQYFSPELAQSAVTQQVENQFAPLIDQTIGGIKQDFSNRNLFRSGLRGQQENLAFDDLASRAATLSEQLLGNRINEAREGYSTLQSQFEKSPTTYTGPKSADFQPYTVSTPQQYGGTQDIYGGASTSTNAPYSYLQAYRDYLKKKTPDYYKKYYGVEEDPRGVPREMF